MLTLASSKGIDPFYLVKGSDMKMTDALEKNINRIVRIATEKGVEQKAQVNFYGPVFSPVCSV